MATFTNDYVFVDDDVRDTNALQEPFASDSNDEGNDDGSLSIQDSSYEDLNEDDDEAMSMMMHHDSFHSIRDEFERVRLDKLRRELEAIKLQGKITARQQQWEMQQAQLKCHMVQTKLQEQLMERTHQSMYMRFLTYEYAEYDRKKKKDDDDDDGSKPFSATTTITTSSAPTAVSTYVLQQETPLLSIMHRAFLVMPNQMEVTQICYRKHLFSYLSKEVRCLRRKNAQASEQVVHELSSAAEENDRLYDAYQERVEEQERQLRELRRQLWHRSPEKLSLTSKAELCETEHSETTYSEEDCTDRGCDDEEDDDDAVAAASPTLTSPRFPKVTKLLLTPTERISKSFGKNVQHLRNMVAAGDKFQLPF